MRRCTCRACQRDGIKGLKGGGIQGFSHRASHNLWVLLREAEWVAARLAAGTYAKTYRRRVDNTIYAPIVQAVVEQTFARRP